MDHMFIIKKDMSKPEFYNIKKFKKVLHIVRKVLINWLNERYNIPLNS